MKTHIKLVFGVALAIVLGVISTVSMPVISEANILPVQNCVNLYANMQYGSSDYYTNGDVTRLQNFLNTNGYMQVSSTGYFGTITLSAVQRFQANNGLYSAGYVGPLTRAKILAISCGGNPIPLPPPIITTGPILNSSSSLSPTYGPVGALVTITGVHFNSTSRVLFDSNPIQISSNYGNQITFIVPSSINPPCYYSYPQCLMSSKIVVPGSHSIIVENNDQYGIQDSIPVTFNVTTNGGSGNQAPVINGLDSPSALNIGQTGTWIVHATDYTGGGLNYSVVWGDEGYASPVAAYGSNVVGQTSTFTHVYNSAGTFTPTFTVTGSNGLIAKTSATVVVGGVNNSNTPAINSIYPSVGSVGSYVTLYGTSFGPTDTILFGGGPISGSLGISSGQTTLSFIVPSSVGADCQSNMMCPMYQRLITPGTYEVKVRNSGGTSNTVLFQVQ
jgi:peptidoglycan hydrolase-like protein with peptidoglycan-binding domain